MLATLADEGFRLFFPIAAVYLALFPLVWIVGWGFSLPLARTVPPSLWHAHEMMIGGFGAALIGFLTTAAPEWTDTEPPRGRPLLALAALWVTGRVVGLFGWDAIGLLGAAADLAWMSALLVWLIVLSWRRRTDRLVAFIFWMGLIIACAATARGGFALGDLTLATNAIHLVGFAFLGLLGLALSRITVPVTNLVLDPTEQTSPFRPHPGRLHLASGLVFLAMAGDVAGLSPAVSGYLIIAAGAAFMDRVSEGFIGARAARAEILMLAAASALAGTGLMLAGAARLGAPWAEVTGLHVAFMGGLGLSLYAVFCVAGLLHTGRPLGLSRGARVGALMIVAATFARVAPDFGVALPAPARMLASAIWCAGFLVWLSAYWRILSSFSPPDTDADTIHQAPEKRALGVDVIKQAAE